MRLHQTLGLAASITVLVNAAISDSASAQRGRQNGPRALLSEPCDPCGSDGGTGTELLFRSTPQTPSRQLGRFRNPNSFPHRGMGGGRMNGSMGGRR
jgi:hypothetical protein